MGQWGTCVGKSIYNSEDPDEVQQEIFAPRIVLPLEFGCQFWVSVARPKPHSPKAIYHVGGHQQHFFFACGDMMGS